MFDIRFATAVIAPPKLLYLSGCSSTINKRKKNVPFINYLTNVINYEVEHQIYYGSNTTINAPIFKLDLILHLLITVLYPCQVAFIFVDYI